MICKIEGCERPVSVRKRMLCISHYQMWIRESKPRVGQKPCSINDCKKHMYARDMCREHYSRWLRSGNPIKPIKVRGKCTEEDCENVIFAGDMCKRHYSIWYYHYSAGKPITRNAGHRKEVPGYTAAHNRVRRARGKASDFECVGTCGGMANEWALSADATDLHFASERAGRKPHAYSLNINDYQPMCGDCHRAYDAETLNRHFRARDSRWTINEKEDVTVTEK